MWGLSAQTTTPSSCPTAPSSRGCWVPPACPWEAQGSCGVGQPYSSELCAYAPTYDNYVYQMKMESRTSPYNRPAVPYPGYPTPTTQAYNSLYPPRTKQTTSYDY
ncbi:hypothetical protein HPB47_008876 [Ixodes persulcatus]|uniref:Uncharacterized protein n=1 Tax=Ixodes persulcatus TaxID=34615 RepID=A0AC60P3N1_IXOPE|nr:hypothetical protein HPB47_008876 [Ixodes persulcatus]